MTTSPIPASALFDAASIQIGGGAAEDERFLLQAFRIFSRAAASFEQSYRSLQSEVERLRRELNEKNKDLAHSLEAARDARLHLERILEGLPCGVLVVSDNGEILETNPEALRLVDAASLSRRKGRGLIAALPDPIQSLLEGARGEEEGEREGEFLGQENESRWIAARSARIREDTCVYILRDVTERKRLEQAQAKLHREVALAEMSAILAHEIRNPLGSLELFAGLLADSGLDGERAGWVEHVQAGLRALAATVNNVLHFHGPADPDFVPVDLGQLLEWARDFCAPLAHQRGITLSLQNELAGVFLAADRHRLEQVLLNLVLNSVHAIAEEGWIQLSGRIVDDAKLIQLAVADTGPGIRQDQLPKLFEFGFSTRPGGAGLGLAVCRQIVEQHGGTISADSTASGGAIFKVSFALPAQAGTEVRE